MQNTINDNQELFLATTALEEFWDTSKPIIFLSDACLRYSRKEFWKKLNCQIFKSPLENKIKFSESYSLVSKAYEQFLLLLTNKLNKVHKIERSVKFWRIFIGPWLMHYIHILYERYICIKSVLHEYPQITTIVLSDGQFVTPNDFSDFIDKVSGDVYNLQLYTKILFFFGKVFPKRKWQILQPEEKVNSKGRNNKIKKIIKKLIKNFSSIIVKNSYFSSQIELELFIKTRGRVFFEHDDSIELPQLSLDIDMRNRLAEEINNNYQGHFEVLLTKTLPLDIPKVYIEGFKILDREIINSGKRPKVIISSESWYFDEVFKFWAASCSEKGTSLIGIQHGSNYGIASIIPQEQHELKITSKFYSWGWKDKNNFSSVKPCSAPRLMNRGLLVADNKKEGILLIVNNFLRYFYRFQDFRNYDNSSYFEWQRRFFNAVTKEIRKNLKIRLYPYPIDLGNDCRERWLDSDNTIFFENLSTPFQESLKNCRLAVHDHLGNTFLESLSINKPTILFWNPEVFSIRSEAQPFFEKLKESGILFYNPEEAARAVSKVYNDVEGWWLCPSRQEARRDFCNEFAIVSPDAVNKWSSEFINLLNNE